MGREVDPWAVGGDPWAAAAFGTSRAVSSRKV